MKIPKRLLTTVLTLALGLGIWGVAVNFKTAECKAGDSLSAEGLNTLFNDNFERLEQATTSLEAKVDDLKAEVAALEAGKLDALSSRLPLAFGSVSGAGAAIENIGTGNFTVVKGSAGMYDIKTPELGEAGYNSNDFITLLQPYSGDGQTRPAVFSGQTIDGVGHLRVRTFNATEGLLDTPFHFIVHPKP